MSDVVLLKTKIYINGRLGKHKELCFTRVLFIFRRVQINRNKHKKQSQIDQLFNSFYCGELELKRKDEGHAER